MRLAILIIFSFFVFSEDEGYATNGDVQIYYKDFGPENNTPVLLVMGLGGQLTYWPQFFIEFLQNNGYVSSNISVK